MDDELSQHLREKVVQACEQHGLVGERHAGLLSDLLQITMSAFDYGRIDMESTAKGLVESLGRGLRPTGNEV